MALDNLTLKTQILLRNDSTANWTAVKDTVTLGKGEVGIEFMDGGKVNFKIGDGTKKWSELSYYMSDVVLDAKSISKNAAGEIQIAGFANAATGAVPKKKADGTIEWVTTTAVNDGKLGYKNQDGTTKYIGSANQGGDTASVNLVEWAAGTNNNYIELGNGDSKPFAKYGSDGVLVQDSVSSPDDFIKITSDGIVMGDNEKEERLAITESSITLAKKSGESDTFVKADKFVVTDGTSSQFLKADGSLDSTAYITADDVPEYTIVKQSTAESGMASTYYLTKDNVQVGAKINIPKDQFLKEAKFFATKAAAEAAGKTVPTGTEFPVIYFLFEVSSGTSETWLPVKDLVDVYTAGNGIDITDNVISAVVKSGDSYLEVTSNGIATKGIDAAIAAAVADEAEDRKAADDALDGRLTTAEGEIDALQADSHTHSNKDVLDDITDAKVAAWDDEIGALAAAQAAQADVDALEAVVIKTVKVGGTALTVTDNTVNIAVAGTALGVVKTSSAENGVAVASDGTMSVNSLNVEKLSQTAGTRLILDGGSASN